MHLRTPIDIGLAIRERRRKLGLDQGELARRVNVSRQWVVEVEKGRPRAELGLVLRTLEALGLALAVETEEAAGEPEADSVVAPDIDAIVADLGSGRP